jgi:molybdenum cofactor cytidylyltransferase
MAEVKDCAKNIAVIILAAGASSRLDTPKQLLMYRGKTLLQQMLQVAADSMAQSIFVVLGANADNIKNNMDFGKAHLAVNANWQEGMASSIRCGINELVRMDPLADGAVLMVCDQPYVTSSILNDLIKAHQNTGKHIVASSYNGTFGVPALFHKNIFPELLQLKGDAGARSIIQQRAKEVEAVLFSKGNVDIDTAADYQELSKGNYKE